MIIVADASVLVGELLRERGRQLLLHPQLRVLVAEDQWEETEHEMARRLEILQSRGILTDTQRELLSTSVQCLINARDLDRPTYTSSRTPLSAEWHATPETGQQARWR